MSSIETTLYVAAPALAVMGLLWYFGAIRKQSPSPDAWVNDYLVLRNGQFHVVHPDQTGMMVTLRSFPIMKQQDAEAFIKKQGPAGLRMLAIASRRRAKSHTKSRSKR